MKDSKDKIIVLRSHEEIASERIPEIINKIVSIFFSELSRKNMMLPISDGYFCFSEKDIETIKKRLNYQPNLFGVHFDTSIFCLSSDISDKYYIRVDSRRT